jgi:hypothetical protein
MSQGMNLLGCRAMGNALIEVLAQLDTWNGDKTCFDGYNLISLKSIKKKIHFVIDAKWWKP